MPFERAVEMLAELTGVQTSEATGRRRSYRVGEAALEAEAARASSPTPEVPEEIRSRCAAVVDGGELPGTPSTVIDAVGPEPFVVREGAAPGEEALERIAAALS